MMLLLSEVCRAVSQYSEVVEEVESLTAKQGHFALLETEDAVRVNWGEETISEVAEHLVASYFY